MCSWGLAVGGKLDCGSTHDGEHSEWMAVGKVHGGWRVLRVRLATMWQRLDVFGAGDALHGQQCTLAGGGFDRGVWGALLRMGDVRSLR